MTLQEKRYSGKDYSVGESQLATEGFGHAKRLWGASREHDSEAAMTKICDIAMDEESDSTPDSDISTYKSHVIRIHDRLK